MLKKISIALVVLVAGFLGYAAMRPSEYRVERSAAVAAPAELVFDQLADFRKWEGWSPWEKLDPNIKKTYEGPARGVGASYSWQGDDKVGKGKMTVAKEDAPKQLGIKLEFIEPFAAVADTTFTLTPANSEQTQVTWAMEGKNNFMGKVFGIFMDMDKSLGAEFEKGLTQLNTVAKAEADKKRAEEAAAAQAAAAPAPEPAPAP
jgi:Polyketide cyclase / dehydrase and lipid transport